MEGVNAGSIVNWSTPANNACSTLVSFDQEVGFLPPGSLNLLFPFILKPPTSLLPCVCLCLSLFHCLAETKDLIMVLLINQGKNDSLKKREWKEDWMDVGGTEERGEGGSWFQSQRNCERDNLAFARSLWMCEAGLEVEEDDDPGEADSYRLLLKPGQFWAGW